MPDSPLTPELDHYRALIARHRGSISSMARVIGVTRQILDRKLKRLGLGVEAARVRKRHGITGPRAGVDEKRDPEEKTRIEQALIGARNYRAAAKALGMSDRSMLRKMRTHRIGAKKIAKARARQAALQSGAD